MSRRAIKVEFLAAPLAVDAHGARQLLGAEHLSPAAWKARWWRFRKTHDLEPVKGLAGFYQVRAIERALAQN